MLSFAEISKGIGVRHIAQACDFLSFEKVHKLHDQEDDFIFLELKLLELDKVVEMVRFPLIGLRCGGLPLQLSGVTVYMLCVLLISFSVFED